MDILALADKIKELNGRYPFQENGEGYQISASLNEQLIRDLNDCEQLGIPITSYFDGEKYREIKSLHAQPDVQLTIQISSEDLSLIGLNVYTSWDDFLKSRKNIFKTPENFLILSDGVIFPQNSKEGKIKHYLEVRDFLTILIKNADHTINLTSEVIEEVIFLHKTKIEIPILLDEMSIQNSLDGFTIIKSLFEDNSHVEQKKSILKEVLYGLLNAINKSERLLYLLSNFGEFSKRLSENYQLFVSEFSFDDVRKEYEESKREYIVKLNDIFASVQTKMLGIPISLAVASIKLSPIIDITTFWSNLLLFLAVGLYSWMMFILISNQKHTLSSVRDEYRSQMTRLRHQYSEQYDSIKQIQIDLDTRYDFQIKSLQRFKVLILALLLFIFALFAIRIDWSVVYEVILQNELSKYLLTLVC